MNSIIEQIKAMSLAKTRPLFADLKKRLRFLIQFGTFQETILKIVPNILGNHTKLLSIYTIYCGFNEKNRAKMYFRKGR